MKDKPMHTVNGVATMLSLSRSTIYKLIRTGELEATKVGGRLRITDASVTTLVVDGIIKAKQEE